MRTLEETQDQAISHLLEAVRILSVAVARRPEDPERTRDLQRAKDEMDLADYQLNGARER